MSPERVSGFVSQARDCGVEIVDSLEAMKGRVDAMLVLSVCGSDHLSGARPFLEAGIPTYVDKPFACSLHDALEMLRLAKEHNALLYHTSALPFAAEVVEFRQRFERRGPVHGAISYGPAKRHARNPGLFHYGVHSVALLFELMGGGCESVANEFTEGAEVATGRWTDGRIGTLRGNRRGATGYGFLAFCENGVVHRTVSTRYAYRNLCESIVDAFETGTPPVSHERNLEEMRFILAAMQSEQSGGNRAAV